MRFFQLSIIAVVLIANTCSADGLVYQLPKDGAWAKFDMTFKVKAGKLPLNIDGKGYLKMSSVGMAVINNEKYRWLEFEMKMTMQGGKDQHNIMKLLIAESFLKDGQNPITKIAKCWMQESKAPPRHVKTFTDEKASILVAFLPETLADQKKLKAKTVTTPAGKFECKGVRGKSYFRPDNTPMSYDITNTIWRNAKAPFGVVKSKIDLDMVNTENAMIQIGVTMQFTLREVGTNAKSALPNSK